jgi:cell division protein FtsW (lipid II flippase)
MVALFGMLFLAGAPFKHFIFWWQVQWWCVGLAFSAEYRVKRIIVFLGCVG